MSELAAAPTEVPCSPRSPDAARQAWAERLARFASAGLTAAQFCAAEGVSVAAFYQWKRRLGSAALPTPLPDVPASPRLLSVHLANPTPAIELVLPSGVVLRLGPGVDEASLRSLLRLLGVASC